MKAAYEETKARLRKAEEKVRLIMDRCNHTACRLLGHQCMPSRSLSRHTRTYALNSCPMVIYM